MQIEKQLFVTARNANNVSRVKSAVKKSTKTKHRDTKHAECQPARMRKDEEAVISIVTTLNECEVRLFHDESPVLCSIQSGIPATPETKQDFNVALLEGANAVQTLLRERVFSKTKNLLDPIPDTRDSTLEI